jgi:hypothetical protein
VAKVILERVVIFGPDGVVILEDDEVEVKK